MVLKYCYRIDVLIFQTNNVEATSLFSVLHNK